eukprot:scaffold16701_cov64-Cyclotella_meneghiniana.AAC.8
MSTPEEVVSVAPTDASVAGSSVAVTEAEEDALCDAGAKETPVEEVDDQNLAPMHFHALRSPAKLKGTATVGNGRRSRSSSRSRPGSRKNSNSPNRGTVSPGGSLKGGDAGSVASSIDEDLDPDILLDRGGFQELDPKLTEENVQRMLKKHLSDRTMPTLNERMCDDTMDDSHAFQDLKFVKKNKGGSGDGSPSNGSLVQNESDEASDADIHRGSLTNFTGLEALDEEEEDDDDEEHVISNANKEKNIVDPSPASSISGDIINLTESDLYPEERGDVVVELPDSSIIQKEHDIAAAEQDNSVMAVEDKSDNDDINLGDEEEAVVVGLDPSMIQKEHDIAAAKQDNSVMAVEDKSENEEINLGDEEAIDLPTSIMEELRISDECRQNSRDYDSTER